MTKYCVCLDIDGEDYQKAFYATYDDAVKSLTWAIWNNDLGVYLGFIVKLTGKRLPGTYTYELTGDRIAVWRRYGRLNEKLVKLEDGTKCVDGEAYVNMTEYWYEVKKLPTNMQHLNNKIDSVRKWAF